MGADSLRDVSGEAVRAWAAAVKLEERGIVVGDSPARIEAVRVLMLVCQKVEKFENVVINGESYSDPFEVMLRVPFGIADGGFSSLMMEHWNLIEGTSGLTGDEVKNFVERFDGRATRAAENAISAGAGEDQGSADTPPAKDAA